MKEQEQKEREETDDAIVSYILNTQMLLSTIVTLCEITKNRTCGLYNELSEFSSSDELNSNNIIMEQLHDFAADLHNIADVIVEICDAMDKLNEKLQSNG